MSTGVQGLHSRYFLLATGFSPQMFCVLTIWQVITTTMVTSLFPTFVSAQHLEMLWKHSPYDYVSQVRFSPNGKYLLEQGFNVTSEDIVSREKYFIRVVDSTTGSLVLECKSERLLDETHSSLHTSRNAWMIAFFASDSKSIWLIDATGTIEQVSLSDGKRSNDMHLKTSLSNADDERIWMFGEKFVFYVDKHWQGLYGFQLGNPEVRLFFDYKKFKDQFKGRRRASIQAVALRDDVLTIIVEGWLCELSVRERAYFKPVCELKMAFDPGVQSIGQTNTIALSDHEVIKTINLHEEEPILEELSYPARLAALVTTSDLKLVVGYPFSGVHEESSIKIVNRISGHVEAYPWSDEPGHSLVLHEESEYVGLCNRGGDVSMWKIVR